METQNITLSLPKSALRKVKLLAVKRNSSISRLVTDAIEKMLSPLETATNGVPQVSPLSVER